MSRVHSQVRKGVLRLVDGVIFFPVNAFGWHTNVYAFVLACAVITFAVSTLEMTAARGVFDAARELGSATLVRTHSTARSACKAGRPTAGRERL
jgi:hypothetical protein